MILHYAVPIANHLWQSTLFAVAIWILTLMLRNNRAAVRHGLWLAASVKFLVPFSLFVTIGSQFQWKTTFEPPPRSVSFVVETISYPFTTSGPSIASPTPTPAVKTSPWLAFAAVWILGFAVSIVSWFIQWQRVSRAMRHATRLNLDAPIPVLSCGKNVEPGVFGILKPVLLLPDGILNRLSPPQLQVVLAHELCHVRRRDNMTAAIHMFVAALFWFHPLVWWIKARLVEEQERACDQEVLQMGGDAQTYAESILRICEFTLASPLLCVSGITGSDLKKRIENIMRRGVADKMNLRRRLLLTVAGVAAIVVPIAIGMLNAPAIQAKAQDSAGPVFEVASIRLNTSNREGNNVRLASHGRLEVENFTLKQLIEAAYGVRSLQVNNLPGTFESNRYDISARAGADVGGKQLWAMVQKLLMDRFKLQFHYETKNSPIYALTVGKNGPKLPKSAAGDCQEEQAPPNPSGEWNIKSGRCGSFYQFYGPQGQVLIGAEVSAADLAYELPTDHVTVDRTGLNGRYNVFLRWTPVGYQAFKPGQEGVSEKVLDDSGVRGPSIFEAVEDELGLKLEATRGNVDFLIIDRVEKLAEN